MLTMLSRGLTDKVEVVTRTGYFIVANMCEIVEDPTAMFPTMSKSEPFVEAACEKMSNPEARNMAEKAFASMATPQVGVSPLGDEGGAHWAHARLLPEQVNGRVGVHNAQDEPPCRRSQRQ